MKTFLLCRHRRYSNLILRLLTGWSLIAGSLGASFIATGQTAQNSEARKGGVARAAKVTRTYHPYTIAQVTAEDPLNWKHPLSHIEIEGWVAYVKREEDGDLHIRVCDSSQPPKAMDAKHCMVAEVIPTLTPKEYQSAANWRLKKGMHLIVRGIYRWDGENPGHHWAEVHPVEEMELMPKDTR